MTKQPILETFRLKLRPVVRSDASDVQSLAGDYRVAKMTESIPHPYEDGMAEEWISTHKAYWQVRKQVTWAVCSNEADQLMGCIGLILNGKHHRASLGYWIAHKHRGKGYCTEAAIAVLDFGFDSLNLQRIEALHLTINPASGTVMQKIGMTHEGTMRSYVLKEGVYEDMERYAIVVS